MEIAELGMSVERFKSKNGGDSFFVLKMPVDMRADYKTDFEKTLAVLLKEKEAKNSKDINEGIIVMEMMISLFSRMKHTKYDIDNMVSTIISNHEVPDLMMNLLVAVTVTQAAGIIEQCQVLLNHKQLLEEHIQLSDKYMELKHTIINSMEE